MAAGELESERYTSRSMICSVLVMASKVIVDRESPSDHAIRPSRPGPVRTRKWFFSICGQDCNVVMGLVEDKDASLETDAELREISPS
jgi:hypothetical protein